MATFAAPEPNSHRDSPTFPKSIGRSAGRGRRRKKVIELYRADRIMLWIKGPDVLDVGCGGRCPQKGGRFWLHGKIVDRFPGAWGIDLSREHVDKIVSLGYNNVLVADAQSFELPQRFDSVVAGEIIEHLENPDMFLKRCAAHLKPHGRIVLTTPYPFCVPNFAYALLRFPRTCTNLEHVTWFCPSTLHALSERARLDVRHWELIEDYYPGGSLPNRILVRLISTLRWLLPGRVRCNSMLFVLSRAGMSDEPISRDSASRESTD
jgi:SAM-dependent methyltransferase